MTDDLEKVLQSRVALLRSLALQRENLEAEMAKLRHFIAAAIELLPEDKQANFEINMAGLRMADSVRAANLSKAVSDIVQTYTGFFGNTVTVAQVRDWLTLRGFDFTEYRSNPLATISTTLKRLSDGSDSQIEAGVNEEGVAVYRWKKVAVLPPPETYGLTVEEVANAIAGPPKRDHEMRLPKPPKPVRS